MPRLSEGGGTTLNFTKSPGGGFAMSEGGDMVPYRSGADGAAGEFYGGGSRLGMTGQSDPEAGRYFGADYQAGAFDPYDGMYGEGTTSGRVPSIPWGGSPLGQGAADYAARGIGGPVAFATMLTMHFANMAAQSVVWAKWRHDQPGGYSFPAGPWTIVCSQDPALHPEQPIFFVGDDSDPALPVNGYFCNNGGAHAWNKDWGATIPAGVTFAQLSQQNVRDPVLRDARTFLLAGTTTGQPSTAPIPFAPGQKVMPLPLSAPAPAAYKEVRHGGVARRELSRGLQAATNFEFGHGAPPGGGKSDTPHAPAPPPPGEKEKKFQLGKGGAVGDAFGFVTEVEDAADCLIDAIYNNKPHAGHLTKSPFGKAQFIAKNFDLSNSQMVEDAISCMIKNEIGDKIIGKLNQAAGKAFGKASGAPRGPGIKRGPGFGVPTRMR